MGPMRRIFFKLFFAFSPRRLYNFCFVNDLQCSFNREGGGMIRCLLLNWDLRDGLHGPSTVTVLV